MLNKRTKAKRSNVYFYYRTFVVYCLYHMRQLCKNVCAKKCATAVTEVFINFLVWSFNRCRIWKDGLA